MFLTQRRLPRLLRTNRVLHSEALDNAVWAKANCSISADAIAAPDGSLTADKLVEAAVTNTHPCANTVSILGMGCSSIYAKAGERTFFALIVYAGAVVLSNGAVFSLGDGTVVSTGSAVVSASIVADVDGWYRCIVRANNITRCTVMPMTDGTTSNYEGDGTSGLYFWGGQSESGPGGSYIPTGAVVNSTTVY